jgi:hypothetical protein
VEIRHARSVLDGGCTGGKGETQNEETGCLQTFLLYPNRRWYLSTCAPLPN